MVPKPESVKTVEEKTTGGLYYDFILGDAFLVSAHFLEFYF